MVCGEFVMQKWHRGKDHPGSNRKERHVERPARMRPERERRLIGDAIIFLLLWSDKIFVRFHSLLTMTIWSFYFFCGRETNPIDFLLILSTQLCICRCWSFLGIGNWDIREEDRSINLRLTECPTRSMDSNHADRLQHPPQFDLICDSDPPMTDHIDRPSIDRKRNFSPDFHCDSTCRTSTCSSGRRMDSTECWSHSTTCRWRVDSTWSFHSSTEASVEFASLSLVLVRPGRLTTWALVMVFTS